MRERARRVPVERRGEPGERGARVRNRNERDLLGNLEPFGAAEIGDDRRRTAGDSGADEIVSVALRTAQGDKSEAAPHGSRIVREPGDRPIEFTSHGCAVERPDEFAQPHRAPGRFRHSDDFDTAWCFTERTLGAG